jgi:hypothetical protein
MFQPKACAELILPDDLSPCKVDDGTTASVRADATLND